jgi:GT2 family glycosyltransferase
MYKLAVSVVVYSSDLALLSKVVQSVDKSCLHAAKTYALNCVFDLVNNNIHDENQYEIAKIAELASRDGFSVTTTNAISNGGYGAGNNISIKRHEDSTYHLVLNPDVLLSEDSLKIAIEYMDGNADTGLLSPQVIGFDGNIQHLCKLNPTLLDMFIRSVSSQRLNAIFRERNRRFEMRDRDYSSVITPVPYPTGCFMFFRRSVIDRIGGFDEGYFLHYEDADIGRQVSAVSITAYVPGVVVHHKWSRDTHKSWRMRWVTIKSGLRYWRKWGGVF